MSFIVVQHVFQYFVTIGNYKSKSFFQYFYLDYLLYLSTTQKVPTTSSSASTSTEKSTSTTQGNGSASALLIVLYSRHRHDHVSQGRGYHCMPWS